MTHPSSHPSSHPANHSSPHPMTLDHQLLQRIHSRDTDLNEALLIPEPPPRPAWPEQRARKSTPGTAGSTTRTTPTPCIQDGQRLAHELARLATHIANGNQRMTWNQCAHFSTIATEAAAALHEFGA